jgi:superoxide reductase
VPVIDAPDKIRKAEAVSISLSVGKALPHPNTSEHHIAWLAVYFLPKSEKFAYLLSRTEFAAHGAGTQGPNTSGVYTQPAASLNFKTEKSGSLIVIAYCNIHGLWESSKEIEVD